MHEEYKNLRSLSNILDSKFEGPFGLRFGWDAIIGLIPGLGDVATSAFSFYIIYTASRLGVDSATLVRMALNVLIDNFFDMIPFVGNLFDFYWKSNDRNVKLLERSLANPGKQKAGSRVVLVILGLMLIAFMMLSLYGAYWLIMKLYHMTLAL